MWSNDMLEIVRALTNDMSCPYKNSDENLLKVICIAAFHVTNELDFSQDFTVSMSALSISPDPTVEATRDDSFVNLTTLKAACILDRSAAIDAARNAFSFRDGGSAYDNRAGADALLKLLKDGWCAAYQMAKAEYESDKSVIAGAMVLTPFRLYAYNGGPRPRGRIY